QWPVLVETAEVGHGVAWDVVDERPRAGRAVTAGRAVEGIEAGGHAIIGQRWLDAAGAGVAVAAVRRADRRILDARQIGFEGDAAVVDVGVGLRPRARENDR